MGTSIEMKLVSDLLRSRNQPELVAKADSLRRNIGTLAAGYQPAPTSYFDTVKPSIWTSSR
jgi:hypothetical protein